MDTDRRDTEADLAPAALTLRVIASALLFGVLTFGAVAAVMGAGRPAEPAPVASYAILGFAALSIVGSSIVPSVVTAAAETDGSTKSLIGLYQTRMIVRLAMLEGAAMACLVGYIVDAWWPVWAGVAVAFVGMLSAFPTAGRLRRFVEARRQLAAFDTPADRPADTGADRR